MSWLLNLLMLGKGPPPNGQSFTRLALSGTPGNPYNFVAKTAATVTTVTPLYYYRFVGGLI